MGNLYLNGLQQKTSINCSLDDIDAMCQTALLTEEYDTLLSKLEVIKNNKKYRVIAHLNIAYFLLRKEYDKKKKYLYLSEDTHRIIIRKMHIYESMYHKEALTEVDIKFFNIIFEGLIKLYCKLKSSFMRHYYIDDVCRVIELITVGGKFFKKRKALVPLVKKVVNALELSNKKENSYLYYHERLLQNQMLDPLISILKECVNLDVLKDEDKASFNFIITLLENTSKVLRLKKMADKNFAEKNYDDAIKEYSEAINVEGVPVNSLKSQMYEKRGDIYVNFGNNEQAIQDFVMALDLFVKPSQRLYELLDLLLKIGITYYKSKSYINSIAYLNKLIRLNKSYGDAYYYRALNQCEVGNFESALTDLKKALRLYGRSNSPEVKQCKNIIKKIKSNNINKSNNVKLEQEAINTHSEEQNIINNFEQNNTEENLVNLKDCTIEEILALGVFDVNKAERFIKERTEGRMWYDMDSFVMAFELQPHEMVLIIDRVIFPPKPKVKYVRKLDL